MRPRHKAAENEDRIELAPVILVASMRPRHKAAENAVLKWAPVLEDWLASMRPRHKAAENPWNVLPYDPFWLALQ